MAQLAPHPPADSSAGPYHHARGFQPPPPLWDSYGRSSPGIDLLLRAVEAWDLEFLTPQGPRRGQVQVNDPTTATQRSTSYGPPRGPWYALSMFAARPGQGQIVLHNHA